MPPSVHGKVGGLGHRDEAEPREDQRRSLRSCSPPAATELEAPEHPVAAATGHRNPAFQPQQCPGPQVTRQQQKWVLGPQPPAPETPMTLAPPATHWQQQSRRTLQHGTWQRCLHHPSYPRPPLPSWFRGSRTRGKSPLSQVTGSDASGTGSNKAAKSLEAQEAIRGHGTTPLMGVESANSPKQVTQVVEPQTCALAPPPGREAKSLCSLIC